MKARFYVVPLSFVSILALAACDEQKPQEPTTTPTAAVTAATISEDDLAVQADFEEDAEKTITVATYKTELDSLEKEIEGS